MLVADLDGLKTHYRDDGDPHGPAVVFANSLGTDLRLWDKVVERLPKSLRLIRYDMRGHGLIDALDPPYSMGALISDAEALLDHLGVKDSTFVGLSIGGMIAQGLAVKRMDLVRAMVLSNTAAKIGTVQTWQSRIDAVAEGGLGSVADTVMDLWFGPKFHRTAELSAWRNMLCRQPLEGYIGCCAAIAGTDFYTTTANLTLPTLAIAGSEDGSTPPDLVRETGDLVKGSKFHLIKGAGHLPCVDKPDEFAETLASFLKEIGHI